MLVDERKDALLDVQGTCFLPCNANVLPMISLA